MATCDDHVAALREAVAAAARAKSPPANTWSDFKQAALFDVHLQEAVYRVERLAQPAELVVVDIAVRLSEENRRLRHRLTELISK